MEANCLLKLRVGKILHSLNVRAILLVIHKFTNGFALNLQNLKYSVPDDAASYGGNLPPVDIVLCQYILLRVYSVSHASRADGDNPSNASFSQNRVYVRTSSVLRNFNSSNYHEIPALL